MLVSMLLVTCAVTCQGAKAEPPRGPSALGTAAARKLRAGDIVRLDTGIPNTGVPAIRLWYRPRDGRGEPVLSQLDLLAFAAVCKSTELPDQIHFMADRVGLIYIPNRQKVRVIAIHGGGVGDEEWTLYSEPLKGMAIVEVKLIERGHAVESDEDEDRRIAANDPEPRSQPDTYAIPIAYFDMVGPKRHAALANLPVLEWSTEKHNHRYCVLDDFGGHGGHTAHVDGLLFVDAERRWQERRKRTEAIKRRGVEEARKRGAR